MSDTGIWCPINKSRKLRTLCYCSHALHPEHRCINACGNTSGGIYKGSLLTSSQLLCELYFLIWADLMILVRPDIVKHSIYGTNSHVYVATHYSIDYRKNGNDHVPFQALLCDIRMNTTSSTMHDVFVVLSPNLCTAAWCSSSHHGWYCLLASCSHVLSRCYTDARSLYVANSCITAHGCITVACYSS